MKTNIVNFNNFNFEYFENDCLAKNSIGSNKEWESHITKFVKMCTIENIIDVGANFGYHTVLFANEVKNNVFAFEPQQQNFQLLKNNIEHNNLKNVKIYNNACGNDNFKVKMPLISELTHKNINMGDFTPNYIYDKNYSVVDTVLLDDICFDYKIDLIKIDVQGYEKHVILGAKNILKIHKPILIVEFESFQLHKTGTTCKELFDFIRSNNYYIFYLEYRYPSDHVCVHVDNLENFRKTFSDFIFPHTVTNTINNNLEHGVTEKITF